jgi:hypothetical protein
MPTQASKWFDDMLEAFDAEDDGRLTAIRDLVRATGKNFRLEVETYTDWEESVVDGYKEFPVVTQSFRFYLGDELAYEGDRAFGAELEDPSHLGLTAYWTAIRVDDNSHAQAEELIEKLGFEIAWPTIPAPR